MDWRAVDGRLIRRGELLLSLDFLGGYGDELKSMDGGRVGRPYRLTDSYVRFLTVVRHLFATPYRQLEGFSRALNRIIGGLPYADYSWLRRRIWRLDLSHYEALRAYDWPITVAVDSTGIRVHKSGG